MRLSLKESRMVLLNPTNLDRKSGIRGPKRMGEAPQSSIFSSLYPWSSGLKRKGKALRSHCSNVLYQGTTSVVPQPVNNDLGPVAVNRDPLAALGSVL